MTTYDLGDAVPLQYRAYVDGALADATVALTLVDPAGNETTPAVVHADTGVYEYLVPTSDPASDLGPWMFTWTSTGTLTDVETGIVLRRAGRRRGLFVAGEAEGAQENPAGRHDRR
jgi:hypothetical protein